MPRTVESVVSENVVYDEASARTVETANGQVTVKDVLRRDTLGVSLRYQCRFQLPGDEALYGLGAHMEDFMNLRGKTQYLCQHNLKTMVPMLQSTAGYGLLFDAGCAMIYSDSLQADGTSRMTLQMEAAKAYMPSVQPGDMVSIPVAIEKFGRIAAQTAKQQVIQTIRTAERSAQADNNAGKLQELLTGTVVRVEPTGDVFVQMGQGAEISRGILRAAEQIPGESYRDGQLVRVYVLENHRPGSRSSLVQLSRTHPNVVRRLFELETPEIASGEVEIRNIAREPGSRSKMAVRATVEGVDPVGACVGPRGGRVGAVVEELHGEKIDIVVWNEDPCEYVKAALSPATVVKAELVPGMKACRVVVPDDELSLAIGKEGQNARLAARLTGYKVDIKPVSKAEDLLSEE